MRLYLASALTLLLSPLALSAPTPGLLEDQTPIGVPNIFGDSFSVPGENPLTFCDNPEHDILTIDRVDLSPNPPVPGETLTIKATGTFNKEVDKGSKVRLQVKYGLIRLINEEADLCDEIGNVDLECPLEKGKMSLTKKVDLPKEIPPGTYSVKADVYTKDQDRITCLEARVAFSF